MSEMCLDWNLAFSFIFSEAEIGPPQLFVASRTKLCRFPSNFPDMYFPSDYNVSCLLKDRDHAVALAVDLEDGLVFYSDVKRKTIGLGKLRNGSPIQYITGATSSVEGMTILRFYWT